MALLLTTTTLPGLLTKTYWFVTVDSLDSVLKVKPMLQIAQHRPKQVKKNYTHRKLNTHKLNNPNAEKIVINRNEYSRIQSIYTNDAKITRYSI